MCYGWVALMTRRCNGFLVKENSTRSVYNSLRYSPIAFGDKTFRSSNARHIKAVNYLKSFVKSIFSSAL